MGVTKTDIRASIREAKKKCEALNLPVFIAVQLDEELVTDAIHPGELNQTDPFNHFSRMLASTTDFNLNKYKR